MTTETSRPLQNAEPPGAEILFGSTVAMQKLRQHLEKALLDDLPVLIEGENGTGKEVIGRFLHDHSSRRKGLFLKLNCAALPARLMEYEIYGHERDTKTNSGDLKGVSIGLGSGGTLFLDEVPDMDLMLQQKLAVTVESGHYQLDNSREKRPIDVRFVCASSRVAKTGHGSHEFLKALLKPSAHYHLQLPPLRERQEDITQLCAYLLAKFAREFKKPAPRLDPAVLEAFQQWKWPGNIRELENWMARIVIFGAEDVLELAFNRQILALKRPPQGNCHETNKKPHRFRGLDRRR
jgi:DNA-binding NtrC family response regulator